MIRQKVDYGKYRYSQKEILKYIGESAGFCVLSEVEEETDDQRKKTAP